MFAMMFPRLDRDVTTRMDHCIKAPFVVHPATKRCCIPIPDIDTWKPNMAPRISELVRQPPNPKDKSSSGRFGGGGDDDWLERREAEKRTAVLTPYVNHVNAMLHTAYPLKVFDWEGSAVVKTLRFY